MRITIEKEIQNTRQLTSIIRVIATFETSRVIRVIRVFSIIHEYFRLTRRTHAKNNNKQIFH